MAKQQPKRPPVQAPKKQKVSEGSGSFGYLVRNFALVLGFALLFFVIDKANQRESEYGELVNEYKQLKQSGQNPARLNEVYHQIMDLQGEMENNTSLFKKLFRGYHWAIHDIAIGSVENVHEMEDKATKPLTREDKLAMRVGIWPFIDYINKNTPPDAVIYLPKGDSVISNEGKWNFIYDPEWMEYFIYPRLCVTIGRENENPELAKRVTHVVIVEGKGYDKLKYDVPLAQRPSEGVFPIDHPPAAAPNKN